PFHDNGVPHLQYYVTAVDVTGGESDASNVITVDERRQLPQPASLSSISLNQAIHLQWADNAALSDTARFNWYRVYSMPYDLDHGVCVTRPDSILLEGTTVSDVIQASWGWCRTATARTSIFGCTCRPAIRPCGSCPNSQGTASGCMTIPRPCRTSRR